MTTPRRPKRARSGDARAQRSAAPSARSPDRALLEAVRENARITSQAVKTLLKLTQTVVRLTDKVYKLEERVRRVEEETSPHRLAGYH